MDLGIAREYGSAPTLDTERKWPYRLPRWDPQSISIFGHLLKIDIPTGNLAIDTEDVSYPYYGQSLGIRRHYDAQEQYMQLGYLQNYPNVDPKPHFFGNWSFGFEADVEDVWQTTTFEIQLNAGQGVNGLFASDGTTFRRNIAQGPSIEATLRTYGVAGRLLSDLQWNFEPGDLVLRTLMGPFQLVAGRYYAQTPVDDASANLWVFNPIVGAGFYLGSDYFYDLPSGAIRDVGFPILLTKVVERSRPFSDASSNFDDPALPAILAYRRGGSNLSPSTWPIPILSRWTQPGGAGPKAPCLPSR